MALAGKDKQIIDLSNELAKKLKDQEFKQAWTMAGELSALLKNEEELQLPYQFAIGCSFERSASI